MKQNKTFTVDPDLIYKILGEIVNKIEACGASPKLTEAVVLAGDLQQAIGNQYNDPDPFALIRVISVTTIMKDNTT